MSDEQNTILETEWSHLIDAERLESGRNHFTISPNQQERKRLAQRLGIVSLKDLKVNVVIGHLSGQVAFHVQGEIDAQVIQNCVVSMEPVESHIHEVFESWFADAQVAVSIAKARHEKLTEKGYGEQPILEEKDDPEPFVDGHIDLGELATQYLSLAIDPYPHAEGVEYSGPKASEGPEDTQENPFAALQDWKDKITSSEN